MVHQSQFIEMFGSSDYPKNLLGDLCKILAGKTLPLDVENEGGPIAYIKVADMNLPENDRVVTTSTRSVTEETAKISGILPIGATVFPKNGAAALHNKKRITAITTCVDMNTMGVYSTSDALDPEFLYAFLVHQDVALLTLTGAIPQIRPKDIAALKIPLPPLERQRRYIGMVGQADKSKFGGLKSQFISQFGFPQDGAEKYPSATIESLLQETISGEWGTDCSDDSGTKVIRTTNFTNEGVLDLTDVVVRTIDAKKVEKKQLKKGDIILEKSGGTKDNPVGRLVYFEEDGVFLANNFTQVLRPAEDINSRYLFAALYYLYQTHKPLIKGLGNQTNGIQNLKVPQYLQLQISVPDRTAQDDFERICQQADKSKYLS